MTGIDHNGLRRLAVAILQGTGCEPAEARLVADHLVDANLAGHDSHGVGMLPLYVDDTRRGRLIANVGATLTRDDHTILAFDGGRGYGQRIAAEAVNAAIERCRELGSCLLALRNAGHIGRVGTYGELAAAAGLVAVFFVNVGDRAPSVAPFGGFETRYSTNPVCIAIPDADGGTAVLLDMATSRYAMGKIRVAKNEGRELPPGMLVDAEGGASRDPRVMYDTPSGALLPAGEHKGSGLALVCEILAGVLSGQGSGHPGNLREGGIINNLFGIVLAPGRLVDEQWMHAEIDALLRYVRSARSHDPDGVRIAGDPERHNRERRTREGIVIDSDSWEEIIGAAASLGITRAQVMELIG